MQFVKRNILTICCMAVIMLMGSVSSAFALGGDDLMGIAQGKAVTVFKSVKTIIFVVGGFGLVALAFMAIFGKLDWKKFAMLAVGLAILAAAGAIVEYATGSTDVTSSMGDSFGKGVSAGGVR